MKQYFYAIIIFMFISLPQISFASGLTLPTSTASTAGLPTSGTMNGMLTKIISTLIAAVGSLAILMIIVSGIMYMTSGGDSSKADNAKKLLTYSIVGLVVVILAYTIVKTVATAFNA